MLAMSIATPPVTSNKKYVEEVVPVRPNVSWRFLRYLVVQSVHGELGNKKESPVQKE